MQSADRPVFLARAPHAKEYSAGVKLAIERS
jgi:hypothetical protein